MIVERAAKAVKKPAKDTLLSFAAKQTGVGKCFAIQEFLDQIGAFLGPVILSLVLLVKKDGDNYAAYTAGFAVLGIPALITIALLLFAKKKFPNPENFEPEEAKDAPKFRLSKEKGILNDRADSQSHRAGGNRRRTARDGACLRQYGALLCGDLHSHFGAHRRFRN